MTGYTELSVTPDSQEKKPSCTGLAVRRLFKQAGSGPNLGSLSVKLDNLLDFKMSCFCSFHICSARPG